MPQQCRLLGAKRKRYAHAELYRLCEGFRMPALDRGMFPRREAAGFRKPPKEETVARKRLDVAGAIYGNLRTARGRYGARGTALGRDFDA